MGARSKTLVLMYDPGNKNIVRDEQSCTIIHLSAVLLVCHLTQFVLRTVIGKSQR